MLYLKCSPLRSAILLNDSKLYNIIAAPLCRLKQKTGIQCGIKKESTDCV